MLLINSSFHLVSFDRIVSANITPYVPRCIFSEGKKVVDWTDYSKTYDLLLEYNPAYQEIISDFSSYLESQPPPDRVLDIGAGTGNYSLLVLEKNPNCHVEMVEPDAGMAAVARAKVENFPNVRVVSTPISEFNWETYDLVVAVHSLYVIPGYQSVLRKVSESISQTGGNSYICDIGRILDVSDWRRYIATSIYRNHGLLKTMSLLWKGRSIARENFKIRANQQSGKYWTHTSEEFLSLLEAENLQTLEFKKLYRGYSDRAIVKAN